MTLGKEHSDRRFSLDMSKIYRFCEELFSLLQELFVLLRTGMNRVEFLFSSPSAL